MMPRNVTVDGRSRVVEDLNTTKTELLGETIGRLGGGYVEVLRAGHEYARKYAEDNPVRFPREMVTAALAEAKQEKDQDRIRTWQAVLKEMGDKDYVERPGDVDGRAVLAAVAPQVVERIKPELTYVLGLLMISRGDLKEADKQGTIDAAIRSVGFDIKHDTTLAEATAILTAGVEMFLEDARATQETMGKLGKAVTELFPTREPEPPVIDLDSEPSSSTDSPASTTGPQTSSSTTSPTEKSAV